MEPWDALSLVDMALSLCKTLYSMFQAMKTNRQLCRDLAKKVQALQDPVRSINRSGHVPSVVCRALKSLCENLDSARGLVAKFSQISPLSGLLKSNNITEKFSCVDKKLNDSHQILNTALQIQHGRVLGRVYDTVSDLRPSRRPALPDLKTCRSTSAAVPAACSGASTGSAVAAGPLVVPTSGVMVPLVLPGGPATSSFSATSTTFVCRGISPQALKAALALRPQINITQIYSAEQPAVIGRCSLLPSQSGSNKRLHYY